jgi:hypothetical protein
MNVPDSEGTTRGPLAWMRQSDVGGEGYPVSRSGPGRQPGWRPRSARGGCLAFRLESVKCERGVTTEPVDARREAEVDVVATRLGGGLGHCRRDHGQPGVRASRTAVLNWGGRGRCRRYDVGHRGPSVLRAGARGQSARRSTHGPSAGPPELERRLRYRSSLSCSWSLSGAFAHSRCPRSVLRGRS